MSKKASNELSSSSAEGPHVRPASGPPDHAEESPDGGFEGEQDRKPRPPDSGADSRGDQGPEISQTLEDCKRKIREYVQGISAAYAAQRIRDQELYKDQGYDSITAFIDEVLPIGTSQWYNLLGCAEVRDILEERSSLVKEHLSTAVEFSLPSRVKWTIPLKPHADSPKTVCQLWAAALNRLDNLTKKNIETVVEDITSEDPPDSPGAGPAPGDGLPIVVIRPGDIGAWPERSLADVICPLELESDTSESEASDGDDGGSKGSESDSDGDKDGSSADEEDGDPSRLEHLREEHPELLEDVNDGVAYGLITVAEAIAGGDAPGRDDFKAARKSFEGLSHRGESSEEQSRLPGCISGDHDTIGDREILVAVPTEMLTPVMAKRAVPIGTPQMQSVVGVPLSYFDGRPPISDILLAHRQHGRSFQFNPTNESVDWADYTINPISGCLHTCGYCYARYQAEDLSRYKQGFQPTFFPGRLLAFSEMDPPDETGHPREKNVFVGSMSDVFGKWVPEWMIQRVLDEVEENDGFDYLFLTKFPQKLCRFNFPDNAWVGTTVDKKHRVALAERHFQEVDAKVKWLSCEPLKEDVAPAFDELSMFDCVVIGAQQAMGQAVDEEQPALDWVVRLHQKAREAGCTVYYKENLDLEYPKELPVNR